LRVLFDVDSEASTPMQRPVAISYAVFAVLLVLVAALHLATPLLAALFCYLALTKLSFWKKRWIGLGLFLVLIAVVFSGSVFFLKLALVVLPEIVSTSIPVVVRWAEQQGIELPFTDMEGLRTVALESVRDTLGHLGKYVKIATKEFVFLLIGIAVAVGIFLNPDFEPGLKKRPAVPNLYSFYTARIRERFGSFYRCFEIVIGAQLIISAINTALTATFVYSFSLPYATVVLIMTFICGLLPIIGNVISNSIIIGIAFTISPQMAGYALVFLVTIHKLEYFLNSRIIGGRIDHPMWLTLLALIIGERLMGISGIILAPVILSFIKVEMKKIELAPTGFPEPPQLEEPEPRELVETR
jgi:predicted PurR-regulated permease PerM